MPNDALPLSRYRVLDLAGEKAALCGRILADFGADVIRVEPPGGDPSRNIGPFYHDVPDPEQSLYWFAYNANKRGITLNVASADGGQILRRLAQNAHFLIESFPPGYLAGLGLDATALRALNPGLIFVSISPFGSSGPWRDYADCDLVHAALSGFMYTSGDTDRAPLRISVEQAYHQGGSQAAAAAMIAHFHRLRTGLGQQVEVSIEEAMASSTQSAAMRWEISHENMRREGNRIYRGHVSPKLIWQCQDGYISWRLWVGVQGRRTKALVEWMNAEGMGLELRDVDWPAQDYNKITKEQLDALEEVFGRFFLTHTRAELHEEAVRRGMLLFPVNKVPDVVESRQLEARGYWTEVEHPELDTTLTYPGAAVKSSRFDLGPRFRAPLIGEHNLEIYQGELGFSAGEIIMLKQAGVI